MTIIRLHQTVMLCFALFNTPGPLTTPASTTATIPSITTLPSVPVIYAMGDVHGDMNAFVNSLKLGGLIDDIGHWSGGKQTLVQVGDLLDRGDDEEEILHLTVRLSKEAKAAGGQAIFLNGNHEIMNVAMDLRYVTPGGWVDFQDFPGLDLDNEILKQVPPYNRGRVAAFLPGGPAARLLSERGISIKVGESVFVHGGILPASVTYGLSRLDEESKAWMNGSGPIPPQLMHEEGPIWDRHFSMDPSPEDCLLLKESLRLLDAKRMIVGHTVQEGGIATFCDGQVFAVDVGMSQFYGGQPGLLKITGDNTQILRPPTVHK